MRTRLLNQCLSALAFWLFVAGLGGLLRGQAKPRASLEAKPGVLSGRVFLITVAGDIKPARMANVYLLYMYRSVKFAETHKEDQDSAATEWMQEHIKAMDESAKERHKDFGEHMAVHDFSDTKASDCHRDLRTYSSALGKTIDWVSANKKEWELIIGQADEEGNFRIPVPRAGDYMLLIDGHAGFNNAVWETHPVTIRPGIETTVKMASPEVACVETGN